MKQPTKTELLSEIRRVTAENERLTRLVATQRPELEKLRALERELRSMVFNWVPRISEVHQMAADLLPSNGDDLPTLAELGGIFGKGYERVQAALSNTETGGNQGAMEPAKATSASEAS